MSAKGRDLKDDPQFLCGVAVSVYQNSGESAVYLPCVNQRRCMLSESARNGCEMVVVLHLFGCT